MEETLVNVAIDLSGRYYMVFNADFPSSKIGDFDSELVEDFWQAFAANVLGNYHVNIHYGRNSHHISEGISSARLEHCEWLSKQTNVWKGIIPSTKGTL